MLYKILYKVLYKFLHRFSHKFLKTLCNLHKLCRFQCNMFSTCQLDARCVIRKPIEKLVDPEKLNLISTTIFKKIDPYHLA